MFQATISPTELFDLTRAVLDLSNDPENDAVVVTCGTNGLEELASMRPPTSLGTDALLNLCDAFRVAASPETSVYGPVIVVNRHILSAVSAYKGHTHALDSFRSEEIIGRIDAADRVHLPWHSHAGKAIFDLKMVEAPLPRVDIITSHLGADSALIAASVSAGAAGIVSAGFGRDW